MKISSRIRGATVNVIGERHWSSATKALLWLLLIAPMGCGDGRTPLVLYSPHGRDLLELMEKTYESERPEIDVRWLDMGSQEVYDRIRSEAVNPQADVWFGGPDTIFSRGAEDGLLEPFAPSSFWMVTPGGAALIVTVMRSLPTRTWNAPAVGSASSGTVIVVVTVIVRSPKPLIPRRPIRTQRSPHRVPRNPQPPGDCLDPQLLSSMQPTHLGPILHVDQSPILPAGIQPGSNIQHYPWWTRPAGGSKFGR